MYTDIDKVNVGRQIMIAHAVMRVNANMDSHIIITPDILEALGHKLPHRIKPSVIFTDFNVKNPLKIPKGTIFEKDVFITQSIIGGFGGCTVEGDLKFCDVDFTAKEANFELGGRFFMTADDFELYQKAKSRNFFYKNRSCFLASEEVLNKEAHQFYSMAKKIEVVDYLNASGTEYEVIDWATIITGDVYLHGPYQYDISNCTVIRGDLVIIEDTGVKLPEYFKVTGTIDVRGYL